MREVNYIIEINKFRKFAFDNYVSSNAVLLWYGLFGLNNDLHWREWFKVDNLRLMGYSFIKREATLISARKELIELGLIEFKKGSKGHPSEYRIVMFSEQQQNNYENEAADSTDNVKPDTENNNAEQNSTKQPRMNNEVVADEQPKQANYTFYYYKKPKATNTNNNQYKKQTPRARNNFHNFQQRDIDINALERMLLANNLV